MATAMTPVRSAAPHFRGPGWVYASNPILQIGSIAATVVRDLARRRLVTNQAPISLHLPLGAVMNL